MDQRADIIAWQEQIDDLRIVLRAFMAVFVQCFGAPVALVQSYLVRPKRQEILGLLRGMESVARRVLFLLAARIEVCARKERAVLTHEGAASVEAPALDHCAEPEPAKDPNWDDSTSWRAGFCIPAAPLARRRSRGVRKSQEPIWAHDPLPLARRLEALRRLIDDPAPYATRLARRLQKLKRSNFGPKLLLQALLKQPVSPQSLEKPEPPGLAALRISQDQAEAAAAHFRGGG